MIGSRRLALLGACVALFAGEAAAQIAFYEGDSYRGRVFETRREVADLAQYGARHRGASAIVDAGFWEACEEAAFRGRCVILRRGSYAFPVGMGLEQPVRSVRPVAERAYYDNEAPPALTYPTYEYRRRPNEAVFEASVLSVRAVFGGGEGRCSVERAPLRDAPSDGLGAPVIAHQPGEGTRFPGCRMGFGDAPEYWDATYTFHGARHRVQTSTQPGTTIEVNARGEPRG
jgi:hypothetical protein